MTGTISSILLPPSGWQNPIPGDGNIQKSPSPSHEITSSVPLHTCFLAKSSAKKISSAQKSEGIKKNSVFSPLPDDFFRYLGQRTSDRTKGRSCEKNALFYLTLPLLRSLLC